MKKRRILWGRVVLAVVILVLILTSSVYLIVKINTKNDKFEVKTVKNEVKVKENVEKPIENEEKPQQIDENAQIIEKNYQEVNYRLTSYYTGDNMKSGSVTGSGLSTKSFQVNEKGWYTYQGKLVLAAATNECLNSRSGPCGKWNTPKEGRHYFNYYDEVEIKIDGITYDGIVLDSCGACMFINYEERIDLFVSSERTSIDRGYKGNNPVSVFLEVK